MYNVGTGIPPPPPTPITKKLNYLTLCQPMTHICVMSSHKPIRFYMRSLILDVNTLYRLFCFFKLFPMVSKGLMQNTSVVVVSCYPPKSVSEHLIFNIIFPIPPLCPRPPPPPKSSHYNSPTNVSFSSSLGQVNGHPTSPTRNGNPHNAPPPLPTKQRKVTVPSIHLGSPTTPTHLPMHLHGVGDGLHSRSISLDHGELSHIIFPFGLR